MAEVLHIVIQEDTEGLRGGFALLGFSGLLAAFLFGARGRVLLGGCRIFRRYFRRILCIYVTFFRGFCDGRQVLRLIAGLSAIILREGDGIGGFKKLLPVFKPGAIHETCRQSDSTMKAINIIIRFAGASFLPGQCGDGSGGQVQ